ncbi:MAG: leucine-rich repeat domain-containing protein, partial [Acutalibacteraceae bacterium]
MLLSAPMGMNFPGGFALTASASGYSGTCGKNLTWTLDTTTGILTITGTGEMEDYSWDDSAPWYNYNNLIRKVQIADGVTSIGDCAFVNCTSLIGITIPDSVTSIREWAFDDCMSLTNILIPDSVTSIRDGAFCECTSLTDITIPNSVTSIGEDAFWGCRSLTGVTIPNSVTSIGNGAFEYCTSLTGITVDTANLFYSSDGSGVLYDKNKTALIQFPAGSTLTEYTIPNSVTSIGDGAFDDCMSLTNILIPDSVTS